MYYPSSSLITNLMTAIQDQNIIATAIPKITDEFHSLSDVGWYGTAYLLVMCSLQLLMGKIYKFYPTKPLFMGGIVMFEIGSAICGAAPNSVAFILGRAIQGIGSACMFSGAMVIMFYTIPLQRRPIYQSLFGAIFAVASVIGPLVGGSFTDKLTWRWCFYINLPVGAVSILVTLFFLHTPNQKLDARPAGLIAQVRQLDPIGTLVFVPGIICLVLALQWGGTTYAWNDGRIIALLVIFAVGTVAFVAVQIWKKEKATLPPRIMKQRSVVAAIWYSFFVGSGMNILLYYLPIWFQAVMSKSALESGIMLLPTILSTVAFSIGSGIIASKVGYYAPFFILGTVLLSIGGGLISTFSPSTSEGRWVGYQIIAGVGIGVASQQPMNVIQTMLNKSDVSTGIAANMFARFLGPAVFLPVAQNIFLNNLVSRLETNLPGISASAVTNAGATELKNLASGDDLQVLITQYSDALMGAFYLATGVFAATVLGSILIEWKSFKAPPHEGGEKTKQGQESV